MKCFARVIATLLVAWGVTAGAQTVPDIPFVEGPITGPGPMHPGIRPGPEGTNLEDFDYVTEEYFVSGTAAGALYRTRILIRKPKHPNKFSGMVVGEPTHRGGNALICQFARFGIGHRGHACVTAASRRVNLTNPGTAGAGLYEFNLERYGDLRVADNQANEIIAQVGRLIKSNPSGGPMGGYFVRNIILSGTSDSSGATRTYMSSTTMLDHMDMEMPGGGRIYDGFFVTSTLGGQIVPITDVPTIQMPSQSEVHAPNNSNTYRRDDSDLPGNRFRLYEVAGMSHNDARENPAFSGCTFPLSHFPHGALTFMGLQHLLDWAARGTMPPRAERMAVDEDLSGDNTRVATDEFGNARGGVRSTYLDVPIFKFTIPNSGPGLCSQTGHPTPLPEHVLNTRYKSRGQYVSKVEHRLKELMEDGWFPKEYAADYVRHDLKLFPK